MSLFSTPGQLEEPPRGVWLTISNNLRRTAEYDGSLTLLALSEIDENALEISYRYQSRASSNRRSPMFQSTDRACFFRNKGLSASRHLQPPWVRARLAPAEHRFLRLACRPVM